MIPARTIVALGVSQLIGWGVSFYLAGTFGAAMARDLGWSLTAVHAGFALAIVVMGLVSPAAGRAVDRLGGRRVMSAGAVLLALGCAMLALARPNLPYYLAAWAVLGLGMRLSLYDAAFAALARIAGPGARRAMAQITLLGGLASTVFWPLGTRLADLLGWRGALGCYAVLALLTVALHRLLPDGRHVHSSPAMADDTPSPAAAGPAGSAGQPDDPAQDGLAGARRDTRIAGCWFALAVMLISFLTAGCAAHLPNLLAGLGLSARSAISLSMLWGLGQVSGRLAEVLFGARLHPLQLNLLASSLLPAGFAVGLAGAGDAVAAAIFAFGFGAANGLLTIVRGTLPLVLFDPRRYGAVTGALLVPSFLAMAAAPIAYAQVIERAGAVAALWGSLGAAALVLVSAAVLHRRYGPAKTGVA